MKNSFLQNDTEWCHFLMPFHFTMLRAVVAAGFEVWALITVIIGPKKVWFIIGIELIGVQFDVKSYCETLKSNTASPWFEITSMFSDQNCMTWSPGTAWLCPFWNPKIQWLINGFFFFICVQIFYWSSRVGVWRKLPKLSFIFPQFYWFLQKKP